MQSAPSPISKFLRAGLLAVLASTLAFGADSPWSTAPTNPTPLASPSLLQGQATMSQLPPGVTLPPGFSLPTRTPGAAMDQTQGNAPTATEMGNRVMQRTVAEPPPQPNAFQLFIQQTTGQALPVFGLSLFSQANPFGALESVPVPGNYVVGPGDEIAIKIFSASLDYDQRLIVNREGALLLPKVGPVLVAGTRVSDLESYLKTQLSRVLSDFNLAVSMGKLRGIEVYVVGQARNPGKYVVSSVSTLINALFATGGPTSNGSMRNIQLVRGGKVMGTVDLYDFLNTGDTSHDLHLLQGDVINIPVAGPQVAVMGAIPTAAVYELSPVDSSRSLRDILRMAGGVPAWTTPHEVTLERIDAKKSKPLSAEKLALDAAGLATPLHDGDIVTLYPIKASYQNAVTLRILGAPPVRVPIEKGARVRDVIPNKEALLTSDYYLRRFNVPQQKAITAEDIARAKFNTAGQFNAPWQFGAFGQPGMPGQFNAQGQPNMPGQFNPSGQPNMLGQFNAQGQPNMPGQFNAQGQPNAPGQLDAQGALGVPLPKAGINDELERIQRNNLDQINWGEAIIERIRADDLRPQIISFNLGRAVLDGDPTQNLPLLPGDTITILSQQDIQVPLENQTRMVRLQGEVKSPGLYQLAPGETLNQLIARAGGLTPHAYVFGMEVSRTSVRVQQIKNLDLVIRQMESQLALESSQINISTDASARVQEVIRKQSQEKFQQKIQELRALKPNGRVVMEVEPGSNVVPDFPLEDGDEIKVPQAPGSVTAVGAVYNDNAVIYRPDRTVSDYLKVAGVTPLAERDNLFLVRANGGVVTQDHQGWFQANIEQMKLMPGDTIVVPEKYTTESGYSVFMRGMIDWSQVLGQIGLAAVAIKVLHP